jgi:hypothetical protein
MALSKRGTKRNRGKKTVTKPLSIFWETVVLPTFAPHNARPFRVPGMKHVWNAEFSQQTTPEFDLNGEVLIYNNGHLLSDLTVQYFKFLLPET